MRDVCERAECLRVWSARMHPRILHFSARGTIIESVSAPPQCYFTGATSSERVTAYATHLMYTWLLSIFSSLSSLGAVEATIVVLVVLFILAFWGGCALQAQEKADEYDGAKDGDTIEPVFEPFSNPDAHREGDPDKGRASHSTRRHMPVYHPSNHVANDYHAHHDRHYTPSVASRNRDHQSVADNNDYSNEREPSHASAHHSKYHPAIRSSAAPPYTNHLFQTGHHAFPTHYAHESDSVPDAWDAVDRRHKEWYARDRRKRYDTYQRCPPALVHDLDRESASGYALRGSDRAPNDHGSHQIRRAREARIADLRAYGHCHLPRTGWSALQYDPPRCRENGRSCGEGGLKRRATTNAPVHLSVSHARVADDFSVGTLLPAFTYREE